MSFYYNRTGPERKALVKAISEILGCEQVYQGAPSFAFVVGDYTIDRNGVLTRHAGSDPEQTDRLIAALAERGYEQEQPELAVTTEACHDCIAETSQSITAPRERSDEEAPPEETVTEGIRGLVVEVPREGFSPEALENLRRIIASKKTLILKALGIVELPFSDGLTFKVSDENLRFPWFPLNGIDGEADAYSRFVCAMCAMAKRQKRITAIEKETDNDKLSMRLFLIRLGFIGPEYKSARKILLRNLTGNSSWKHGRPERAETAESTANTEEAHDGKP